MVPRQSLVFLFLYFFSPANSQNIFSWHYYQSFVSDWTLKQGSTAVKTAAKPSQAVATLDFLDNGRTDHSGDVWGLWEYGTEDGKLSFRFNLAQYGSFFCGITSASLRIKYFSEVENEGRILRCTEIVGSNTCDLPATDPMNWGEESKPVRISDKILEFEFDTKAGKILMIDEVSMIYDINPNDPACKEQPPPPPPNKLQQLLNQFKQNFKQFFSSFFG